MNTKKLRKNIKVGFFKAKIFKVCTYTYISQYVERTLDKIEGHRIHKLGSLGDLA